MTGFSGEGNQSYHLTSEAGKPQGDLSLTHEMTLSVRLGAGDRSTTRFIAEMMKMNKDEVIATLKKGDAKAITNLYETKREVLVQSVVAKYGVAEEVAQTALAEFCGNHAAPAPTTEIEAPPAAPPAAETAPTVAAANIPEWAGKSVKDWTDGEFDIAEDYLVELCASEYRYNLDKAHEKQQANARVQAYIGYADKHDWKRIDIEKARAFFHKGYENEVKEDEAKKLVRSCGKTPRDLYMDDVTADMESHSTTWMKRQIVRGEYDRPKDEKKSGGERPFRK